MNIGKKIRISREELNLDQIELGKMIEVSNISISSWELGKAKPSHKNLRKLAKVLKKDISFFLEVDEKNDKNSKYKNYMKPDFYPVNSNLIFIKVIGGVSNGKFSILIDEDGMPVYEKFLSEEIKGKVVTQDYADKYLFCFYAEGYSNFPVISPNDKIIIYKTEFIDNGRIAYVYNKDENGSSLKVFFNKSDKIILRSINEKKDTYPDIIIDFKEFQEKYLIKGEVISIVKNKNLTFNYSDI